MKTFFRQVVTQAHSLATLLSPQHMPSFLVEQALPALSVCCDEWYGSNEKPTIGGRFLELPNTLDLLAKTAKRAFAGFSAENRKTNYRRSFVHYIFRCCDYTSIILVRRVPARGFLAERSQKSAANQQVRFSRTRQTGPLGGANALECRATLPVTGTSRGG